MSAPRALVEHGVTLYGYGCRCPVCREAKRAAQRVLRRRQQIARRRALLGPLKDSDNGYRSTP